MLDIAHTPQTVHLILGTTDMRKSIDGLCAIVKYYLNEEPASEQLFVFCNRQRDKIKILQWAHNGFWLHYKRLEKGRFRWPEPEDQHVTHIVGRRELSWLLDGLPLAQTQAHQALKYVYF